MHSDERAVTGIVTLYMANVGVAYPISPYSTKKSCSHDRFLPRSQVHLQFSSVVTWSQAVVSCCDPAHSSKYSTYWSDHSLDHVSLNVQTHFVFDHCLYMCIDHCLYMCVDHCLYMCVDHCLYTCFDHCLYVCYLFVAVPFVQPMPEQL